MTKHASDQGIRGELASLYDVFVDWPGRLGREMPGLRRRLEAAGARRVLDVGCATGRHIEALRQAGYQTHGADVSSDMLRSAAERLGDDAGLHAWRLGDPPPRRLLEAAPFDAIACLGNVWPAVTTDADVAAACRAMRDLLQPGGTLLIGLKALAVRRESGNPYMPLLKRTYEGRPIFFIRTVDFDVPPGDCGEPLCDFHMVVVRGGGADPAAAVSCDIHEVRRLRTWSPGELGRTFGHAGLAAVAVSACIGDPSVEPTGEDVFVHAQRPADA
ncbi:MAG: methyltransferase domain-containing protein [Alphaproteobacteria bacterium]|jgi:SAM-dependent methyltransferase|nr:methyltransferase domain-containing protein [Alphaproteobacteria bacterium]